MPTLLFLLFQILINSFHAVVELLVMGRFYDLAYWKQVEESFAEKDISSEHVYTASWLLMIDTWLWLFKGFDKPEESYFVRLAELTRDVDEAPLRIAHCIRDLAFGDESRTDDLVAMSKSDDPAYRSLFEKCYWRDAEA